MHVRVIIDSSSGNQNFHKNMESIVEQLLADETFRHPEVIKTAKQNDTYHAALDFQDN